MTVTKYSFTAKYPPEVAQYGHTQVSNLLIDHQGDIGITAPEMVVLLGLLRHKYSNRNPWPKVETLAKYSGLTRSGTQRSISSLHNKRIIIRNDRPGTSNEYDLSPLLEILKSYAQPMRKCTLTYANMHIEPHANSHIKKDELKKTEIRRLSGNSGKPESLADIIAKTRGP